MKISYLRLSYYIRSLKDTLLHTEMWGVKKYMLIVKLSNCNAHSSSYYDRGINPMLAHAYSMQNNVQLFHIIIIKDLPQC